VIFDPLGQYKTDGCTVFNKPSQLIDFLKDKATGNFRVLYVPLSGDPAEHFDAVGRICYARRDLTLCIDEIGILGEGGKVDVDCLQTMKEIVHFGRHRKLWIMCTAQRPTDVPKRLRALASEFRIFQTNEPGDLQYLESRIGGAAVCRLPELKKYDYVIWKDDGSCAVVSGARLG